MDAVKMKKYIDSGKGLSGELTLTQSPLRYYEGFGFVVANNASISGAAGGCQAEVRAGLCLSICDR